MSEKNFYDLNSVYIIESMKRQKDGIYTYELFTSGKKYYTDQTRVSRLFISSNNVIVISSNDHYGMCDVSSIGFDNFFDIIKKRCLI